MPERHEVYAAIDGEREYQADRWKHTCAVEGREYTPDFNKRTEEYLAFIAGYNADLLYQASHEAGIEGVLEVFRKLAALCVACMEANGGCARNLMSGHPDEFLNAPLSRRKVYAIIDTERTYQYHLSRDRTDGLGHTVYGYVVMFQQYLNKAYAAWTDHPGDEYALDVIRKLAGIAVHCMEDHGVIFRPPFEA